MKISEIQEEFGQAFDPYHDYLNEIKRMIEKSIIKTNVPLAFQIAGRVKSLDSIVEKHESGRYIIKKSITELDDLVGIRIVVLFPEYKEQIKEMLKSEFKVLKEKIPNQKYLTEFGYSSIHLILKTKDEWNSIPPWDDHNTKNIEIQIRTLSEHIWAETSHVLFYKGEENIPNQSRRELYRLAALLEVADSKIQDLKENVTKYFEYIRNIEYKDILYFDLFPETLKRVFVNYFPKSIDEDIRVFQMLNREIEKKFEIHKVELIDTIIKLSLPEFNGQIFDEFKSFVLESIEKNKEFINGGQLTIEKNTTQSTPVEPKQ